jgi:hypothetical protein
MNIRQTALGFESKKKVMLEGVLTTPQGLDGLFPALLLCHPHPMLGGNMGHPLLSYIIRSADELGLATLRFNFRGVGESGGDFTNGVEEPQDLKAAMNILKSWPGINRHKLAVVGYSFGASVMLRGLKHLKQASCLVFVSPPVSYIAKSGLAKDKRPKLFVTGQNDRVSQSLELQRALDIIRQPVLFHEIPNADHSLRGREALVAQQVVDFVSRTLSAE